MDAHTGITYFYLELHATFYGYKFVTPAFAWERRPWVKVGELFLVVFVVLETSSQFQERTGKGESVLGSDGADAVVRPN